MQGNLELYGQVPHTGVFDILRLDSVKKPQGSETIFITHHPVKS